jgi:tetratricopeptide (TPR) repeat protein
MRDPEIRPSIRRRAARQKGKATGRRAMAWNALPVRWWLPAGAYLASCLVGALLAHDTTLAFNRLRWVLAGEAIFFSAALWGQSARRLRWGVGGLLALGVGAALLSLGTTDWRAGQLVRLPALEGLYDHLPVLMRLAGSGVPNAAKGANPRMVAGTMALFLPLALTSALFGRGRRLRLLAGLSTAVLLFPLLLSQSPQGLLALGLGGGLALALVWPKSLALQLFAAGAAAGLWQTAAGTLPAGLAQRLLTGVTARLRIWPTALVMARDAAFTGSGLNNFPVIYAQYTLGGDAQPHAHNLLLQAAADGGILGVMAVAGLLGAALGAGIGLRRASDPGAGVLAAGLAGGAAAFAGYGLFDAMTPGNLPALGLWGMLGLLAGAEAGLLSRSLPAPLARANLGEDGGRKRRRRGLLLGGLALLALAGAPIWGSALLVNGGRALAYGPALGPTPDSALSLEWQAELAQAAAWLWPGNSRAYALAGRAASGRGDLTAALTAWQKAGQLEPADTGIQLGLAEGYERLGMEQEAAEHYRAAGAENLLLQRSSTARREKDFAGAAHWAQLAVEADPNRLQAWLVLGSSRQALGNASGAVQAYRQAQALEAKDPTAYEALAGLLAGPLKDPVGAWQTVTQGLAAVPEGQSASLHYQRSRLADRAGDTELAETEGRRAVQLAPAAYGYRLWLGDLLAQEGRNAEALACYQQALARAAEAGQVEAVQKRIDLARQSLQPAAAP